MFYNEENILKNASLILAEKNLDTEALYQEYEKLLSAYEVLLSDIQFITRISDRLQNKLTSINDSLTEQTDRLEKAQKLIVEQNGELKTAKLNLEEKVDERTRELKTAYEDLLIVNKELDNFVYRAYHDLRGPIARIAGLCYVAKLDLKDQKSLEYFEQLAPTSAILSKVLDKLLAVNKLKNSIVTSKHFGLEAIAEKAGQMIALLNGDNRVFSQVSFPENCVLHTDEWILERLVEGLVEFALKNINATSTGNTKMQPLMLKFSRHGENSLKLTLSYKGLLIPEATGKQIFELFHRTTNNPDLIGTELYSANMAALKLKAKITLESSTETETVFAVLLPGVLVEGQEVAPARDR